MPNPFAVAARRQESVGTPSFRGASMSRLFADWAVATLSPDREIRWALRELRTRARDLVRNNPYAAGVVDSFADNIIGSGIRLKPRNLGPDEKPARRTNWAIENAWTDWGEDHATVDGVESWRSLQRLLIKTWVTDGEVFVREHRGSGAYAYQLEILDADLLDETHNVPADADGVEIRMGVEVDRRGRRLAYHFWKTHPSERGARERVRVPAAEVIHFFVRYRPGQTRGYSLFAPVLTTVKMVDGLTEAELVASRMAAAKMGFIENVSDEAIAAYGERLRILTEQGKEPDALLMDLAPGLIEELAPGQQFKGFDPDHPNTAFEAFLKVMLRGVARGFGMSYLTLTGDVADANYSSMRAGLLPERDHWRFLQVETASQFHRRVYLSWLPGALVSGRLVLPSMVASDYRAHVWRPRGWKWVDPLKDLLALELGIFLGVDSRQSGAAEQGRDFETVVDELRDEMDYAEQEDVYVGGSKGVFQAPADSPNPNGNGNGQAHQTNGRGQLLLNRITQLVEAQYGQD